MWKLPLSPGPKSLENGGLGITSSQLKCGVHQVWNLICTLSYRIGSSSHFASCCVVVGKKVVMVSREDRMPYWCIKPDFHKPGPHPCGQRLEMFLYKHGSSFADILTQWHAMPKGLILHCLGVGTRKLIKKEMGEPGAIMQTRVHKSDVRNCALESRFNSFLCESKPAVMRIGPGCGLKYLGQVWNVPFFIYSWGKSSFCSFWNQHKQADEAIKKQQCTRNTSFHVI